MSRVATGPRPEGVRIVRADGTAMPIELAHAGLDDDGFDHWAVMTDVDFAGGDHIQIDVMPQMCCIEFPLAGWKPVEPS